MRTTLATVRAGGAKSSPLAAMTEEYLQRSSRYLPAEWLQLRSAAEVMKLRERPASALWLLDSRGKLFTSTEFAEAIRTLRDGGKRDLVIAIGPADGWSDADLRAADASIALGKMTLPHEMAALVAAEQIYRAGTILAGHPYHCGH